MKLLLLRGNPRKNGFTRYLTDLFVKGVREAGGQLVDRDLSSLSIKNCTGCYSCWVTSPGKCIISDDMGSVLQDFLDADTVVFATPLNAFTVSGPLKNVMDRLLPLTQPTFEQSPPGLVRNSLRFPEKWPKKFAAIVVGAFKGEENFAAVQSTFSLFANAMSMEPAGDLIRPESHLLRFALAKPLTVKTIETAFVKAGYELATEGRITPETRQKAATPLAPDLGYFKKYSNIYWEHAVALGEKSHDLDLLTKTVMADVRILMQEMARSIDPAATAHLKTTLQFEFTDKPYSFILSVDKGKCTFIEGKTDKPDLKVTTSTGVWAKVFMRQINVRDALMNRQIVLEGDKFIFSRLDRYFPPPVM
ncbi:MAG TPA: NAD(P)H-dependent oxidoreductase [Chitinivibrionales bacterium]|nr:NAD(P)H-dependent oxidoreductase [Chitinivibrionales bacterium]